MADFVNPWSTGMFSMPSSFNAGGQTANTSPLPQPFVPPINGAAGSGYGPPSPSYPGGTLNGRPVNGNGSWGFPQFPTGWNPMTGQFDPTNGGYRPPSYSNPYGTMNGHPLGSGPSPMLPPVYQNGYNPATGKFGGSTVNAGDEVAYQPRGGYQQAPNMVSQPASIGSVQQPQGQTLEQFTASLSNPNAYTSGQIGDMYAKAQQSQQRMPMQASLTSGTPPTNFWQNVGPGGTQNPYPSAGAQPFPSNWGAQRFGFDPRSLAGQQVTGDLGWYYGRDAIGRNINAQGNAVPSFSAPADGFQRRRWYMG